MCEVVTGAILTALTGGGAAATAAGATATAATVGSTIATVGTLVSVAGSLAQGVAGRRAARDQARLVQQQRNTEAQLTAVREQRERARFKTAIAQQSAELAGRGVQLDSATAVFLGQTAAAEMAFSAQSIRSDGLATQAELTSQERALEARGRQSLLRGGLTAAGAWFNREPDAWPGLAA